VAIRGRAEGAPGDAELFERKGRRTLNLACRKGRKGRPDVDSSVPNRREGRRRRGRRKRSLGGCRAKGLPSRSEKGGQGGNPVATY